MRPSSLAWGRRRQDVAARGLGPVYLDFVKKIDAALAPLHRRLLFWGDIAMKDPQDIAALPSDVKQNMIAVAWEYNPGAQRLCQVAHALHPGRHGDLGLSRA